MTDLRQYKRATETGRFAGRYRQTNVTNNKSMGPGRPDPMCSPTFNRQVSRRCCQSLDRLVVELHWKFSTVAADTARAIKPDRTFRIAGRLTMALVVSRSSTSPRKPRFIRPDDRRLSFSFRCFNFVCVSCLVVSNKDVVWLHTSIFLFLKRKTLVNKIGNNSVNLVTAFSPPPDLQSPHTLSPYHAGRVSTDNKKRIITSSPRSLLS